MRKDVGRRRRCPAHRPDRLDVLSEDFRRPGSSEAGKLSPSTTTSRLSPRSSAMAHLGRQTRREMTGDATCFDFVNNELFPRTEEPRDACQSGNKRAAGRTVQRLRGCLQLHEVRHTCYARWLTRSTSRSTSTSSEDRHLFGDIYEKILKRPSERLATRASTTRRRAVTQFMVDMVDPQAWRERARPGLWHRRLPHLHDRAPP